jgi:hypothetical protein
MKTLSMFLVIFPSLLLFSLTGETQNQNCYRVSEANILQINADTSVFHIVNKILILVPGNQNTIRVYSIEAFNSLTDTLPEVVEFFKGSKSFSLEFTFDPKAIQEYLTSAKTFHTHASLTINNVTRNVVLDYVPLPTGTDQKGNFNISLIAQFNPCDFNICETGMNRIFMIKIQNGVVNQE